MAHYVKFEIYLPTKFKESKGREKSVNPQDIEDFCNKIRNEFGGFTESNPVSPPPFKGWWVAKNVEIDYLTYIFTLVKLEDERRAKDFFERWKAALEKKLKQKFILISFYPLQILGDL